MKFVGSVFQRFENSIIAKLLVNKYVIGINRTSNYSRKLAMQYTDTPLCTQRGYLSDTSSIC